MWQTRFIAETCLGQMAETAQKYSQHRAVSGIKGLRHPSIIPARWERAFQQHLGIHQRQERRDWAKSFRNSLLASLVRRDSRKAHQQFIRCKWINNALHCQFRPYCEDAKEHHLSASLRPCVDRDGRRFSCLSVCAVARGSGARTSNWSGPIPSPVSTAISHA